LAYSLVKKAIRIQISPKDPVAKNINHALVFVEMDKKRFLLERLINENKESKMLVFVRTKVRAERVAKAMERVGITSLTLHGDKEQKERQLVMDTFRKGEQKVLIATDISARGIDIANVDYVINYDLPDIAENYVHRVGRTGRGREKGQAIAFCDEKEKELLQEIENFMGKKIQVLNFDKGEEVETMELSQENPKDWKSVMIEMEAENERRKKRGKRKRR